MHFIFLFIIALSCFHYPLLFAEKSSQQSAVISSSDLLGCNPLKDLTSITIQPQYSIFSGHLRAKIKEEISKELNKLGEVVNLTVPDVTGFGHSLANMTIFLKDVTTLSGKQFPVSEISISLSSPTLVRKTNQNCSTYIWSSRIFVEGAVDEKNEKNILEATKAILGYFITDYKKANSKKETKTTFYLYSP